MYLYVQHGLLMLSSQLDADAEYCETLPKFLEVPSVLRIWEIQTMKVAAWNTIHLPQLRLAVFVLRMCNNLGSQSLQDGCMAEDYIRCYPLHEVLSNAGYSNLWACARKQNMASFCIHNIICAVWPSKLLLG